MSLVSAWFFIIPWLRHLPASQFSFNVVSLRRFARASGWGWAMLPRWFRWWMGWYRWYLKQVPAAADILERLCLWPGDRWLWDDRYMSWMSRSRGTGGKTVDHEADHEPAESNSSRRPTACAFLVFYCPHVGEGMGNCCISCRLPSHFGPLRQGQPSCTMAHCVLVRTHLIVWNHPLIQSYRCIIIYIYILYIYIFRFQPSPWCCGFLSMFDTWFAFPFSFG